MSTVFTHDILNKLEKASINIKNKNLKGVIENRNLFSEEGKHLYNFYHNDLQISSIAQTIDCLHSKMTLSTDLVKQVKDLLSINNHVGTFLELMTYKWLLDNNVSFIPQVNLPASETLKNNDYVVDGIIDDVDVCFDIKSFGIQFDMKDQFIADLSEKLPDFHITIEGSLDVSYKDVEKYCMRKIKDIADDLTRHQFATIKELNWSIKANPRGKSCYSSISTFDCFEWAYNNRYFFLKNSSQFTKNKPFILMFSFSKEFNFPFASNFANGTDICLRAVSRRVFFELGKMNTISITNHDRKADPKYNVSDAVKLLSAILFIDVSSGSQANSWLFTNPFAKNPLTRYKIEQMFDFRIPCSVDDFYYDNY